MGKREGYGDGSDEYLSCGGNTQTKMSTPITDGGSNYSHKI
jgi:hypothetical protein